MPRRGLGATAQPKLALRLTDDDGTHSVRVDVSVVVVFRVSGVCVRIAGFVQCFCPMRPQDMNIVKATQQSCIEK